LTAGDQSSAFNEAHRVCDARQLGSESKTVWIESIRSAEHVISISKHYIPGMEQISLVLPLFFLSEQQGSVRKTSIKLSVSVKGEIAHIACCLFLIANLGLAMVIANNQLNCTRTSLQLIDFDKRRKSIRNHWLKSIVVDVSKCWHLPNPENSVQIDPSHSADLSSTLEPCLSPPTL